MESVAKVGAAQGQSACWRQGAGESAEVHRGAQAPRRSLEEGFEAFEREVHRRFAEAEREFVGEELARLDVTLPQVRIDGVLYRRVVSGVGEYMTAAGPVKVLRQRYRAAGTNGASECPLELRAGIVEGFFTPLAARMGLWVVTHLTPAEGEQLFHELGGMSPSRSSLDRLPKALSEKWEERRAQWEEPVARAGAAAHRGGRAGRIAGRGDGADERRCAPGQTRAQPAAGQAHAGAGRIPGGGLRHAEPL